MASWRVLIRGGLRLLLVVGVGRPRSGEVGVMGAAAVVRGLVAGML